MSIFNKLRLLTLMLVVIITMNFLNCKNRRSEDSILVFAGASMTEILGELGLWYEKNKGVKIIFDFQGSGRLVNKILAGQRPDVFIPASDNWSQILVKKGIINSYSIISHNVPVIIKGKTVETIEQLSDFTRPVNKIVLGDPLATSIGIISNTIFKHASLESTEMNIVALGFNVKQLVHWVAAGEADGSIVWNTDVNNIKGIKVIPIKDFFKFRSNVPVCNLNTKSHRVNKFISYLRTDGKGFFKKHGFRVNL